jgi:transcriptional regulator with XRE-family HTH domain
MSLMTLGLLVRLLREKNRLTVAELAGRLERSVIEVADVEAGITRLDRTGLQKYAEQLKVPVHILAIEKSRPSNQPAITTRIFSERHRFIWDLEALWSKGTVDCDRCRFRIHRDDYPRHACKPPEITSRELASIELKSDAAKHLPSRLKALVSQRSVSLEQAFELNRQFPRFGGRIWKALNSKRLTFKQAMFAMRLMDAEHFPLEVCFRIAEGRTTLRKERIAIAEKARRQFDDTKSRRRSARLKSTHRAIQAVRRSEQKRRPPGRRTPGMAGSVYQGGLPGLGKKA